jgi:hypothetical protein
VTGKARESGAKCPAAGDADEVMQRRAPSRHNLSAARVLGERMVDLGETAIIAFIVAVDPLDETVDAPD